MINDHPGFQSFQKMFIKFIFIMDHFIFIMDHSTL